jgi:hypothetical protein
MKGKFLILVFFLFIYPVLSISEEAIAINSTLNEVKLMIEEMKEANFSIQRVSDLYLEAEQLYKAQLALENAGGKPDYSLILNNIEEIKSLKEKAFLIADEIKVLELRIKESYVNTSEVWIIYDEAVREFKDERYEKAEELIEKAYTKLSELESTVTRIQAFYESISKTLENFIKENLEKIVGGIVATIVLIIIFHNRIRVYRLNRKLKLLEIRKKVLRELIAKTQRDYFERGVIGEDTYKIRIKRFGELMRDINRQIPLIKEEIAKVKKVDITKKYKKELEGKEEKIKEKVRGLEDVELGEITKRLLIFDKKIKKPRNLIRRIICEIMMYIRKIKLEREFKKLSK